MMDPGVVEDEDTQWARVSCALGHLQRVGAGNIEKRWACTTLFSIQLRNVTLVNEPSTEVPDTKPSRVRHPIIDVRRPRKNG